MVPRVTDPAKRRAWNNEAVHLIEADYNRTSDTHLILHRFLLTGDSLAAGIFRRQMSTFLSMVLLRLCGANS